MRSFAKRRYTGETDEKAYPMRFVTANLGDGLINRRSHELPNMRKANTTSNEGGNL